jgi:2-polyprenylphenol 6-hydroxylase
MQSFDVVIAGGGMVGLALACGLQGSGLRVAVLESISSRISTPPSPLPGLRVSAINAASERLLQHTSASGTRSLNLRASAYHGMEVWDRDSFGKIAFRGDECGFSHLGHIIENSGDPPARCGNRRRSPLSDVTLLAPGGAETGCVGRKRRVHHARGRSHAELPGWSFGADGAQSWLRQHADIPLTFWDYRHHALVATIRTEEPHQSDARQVFHGDGILAFLPLSDAHLSLRSCGRLLRMRHERLRGNWQPEAVQP